MIEHIKRFERAFSEPLQQLNQMLKTRSSQSWVEPDPGP